MTNHIGNTNKMVLMPTRLTAENGAKAALIGEFFESIEVVNDDYCGCGKCDFCLDGLSEDSPMTVEEVPVSWTTIKAIYTKAVEHFAKPTTWRPIDPTNPDTLPGEDDADERGMVWALSKDLMPCIAKWYAVGEEESQTETHWAPRIKQFPPNRKGT